MAMPRETIELFQVVLCDAGFCPVPVDGKWGPNTQGMMNAFGAAYQASYGVPMPWSPYPTEYIMEALRSHLRMSLAFTLADLQADIAAYERERAAELSAPPAPGPSPSPAPTPMPQPGPVPGDVTAPPVGMVEGEKGFPWWGWLGIGLLGVGVVGGGVYLWYSYAQGKGEEKTQTAPATAGPYGSINAGREPYRRLSW